jgi:hypothetical protein
MALLTLCGVGNAQVTSMPIGYCVGELGSNPSNLVSTTKDDQISAAIFVPQDQVAVFAGNQIKEIKAGLASKLSVTELTVWLRAELDGNNLASATVAGADLVKGWNTVTLDTPFDITAQTPGLYIGYTYTQKNTSKAAAVLDFPQPNALFAKVGATAEWTDLSSQGTLSIEAIVYGDNMPKYNLSLLSMKPQPVYVVDKGVMAVEMMVRNVASATITGFDAVCHINGSDETFTVHIDKTLAYNQVEVIEFTIQPTTAITPDSPAERTLTVTLDNLIEGQDEAMSDNTLEATFQVVAHDFTRVPLVEEFTTEKCTNCPRVAAYLHAMIENEEFKGRFNTVEHHSGYYTDQYTIQADTQWEWFYDNVYAPAIMLDRAAEFGDASGTAVFNPASQSELDGFLRKELLKPAFVSLKIEPQVDEENHQIVVTVSGERSKHDLTVNPARITVMLTETNLVTTNQAGYSGEYVHINVGRRVNATWGDVIEWNGDTYSYTCTLFYSPAYVMDNLGILAFIHDADTNDKLSWEVCNSAAIQLKDITAGVETLSASTPSSATHYYNLHGIETVQPTRGLTIVRHADGRVLKVMK